MRVEIFLRNFTTTVALSSLFLSCTGSSQKISEQAVAQNSDPKINYGNLIIQEPSDYIMIPVIARDVQDNKLKLSYSRSQQFYSNIIFYNSINGDSHLLLNKQAVIDSQIDFLEVSQGKDKPGIRFRLLKIIQNDTNGDKNLDENDAVIGYLSDLSGKRLQQITPSNTQLINWQVDKKRGLIFIRIMKDSDKDKKFTERDETTYIRVNINKPSIGTDIMNDKIRQQLKSLSFK